jgi:hypothetical protein
MPVERPTKGGCRALRVPTGRLIRQRRVSPRLDEGQRNSPRGWRTSPRLPVLGETARRRINSRPIYSAPSLPRMPCRRSSRAACDGQSAKGIVTFDAAGCAGARSAARVHCQRTESVRKRPNGPPRRGPAEQAEVRQSGSIHRGVAFVSRRGPSATIWSHGPTRTTSSTTVLDRDLPRGSAAFHFGLRLAARGNVMTSNAVRIRVNNVRALAWTMLAWAGSSLNAGEEAPRRVDAGLLRRC